MTSKSYSGSHKTFDPLTLSQQLRTQSLDQHLSQSCTNTPNDYYQMLDYAQYKTHHDNMVANGSFQDLNQEYAFPEGKQDQSYELDSTACSPNEWYLSTPTDEELQNISQAQYSQIFDVFDNPNCYGYELDGNDKVKVRNGLVAIVGDFPPSSAEGAFFADFKASFLLDVVPSEQRSRVKQFPTEQDALSSWRSMDGTDIAKEQQCAMIQFRELDFGSSPKKYDQDIKLRQETVSPTFAFKELSPGSTDYEQHITSGQASLQTQVDDFILRNELSASEFKNVSYTYVPMTTIAQREDLLLTLSIGLLFFLLGIAFCPAVVSIVSTLVKDKEFKQREGMAMMGMSTFTQYASFFVYRAIIAFLQAVIMTYQMTSAIQVNSNYFAVFIVFLLLALSTLSISFMLSSIFDSTRNAAIVGTLIYFGSVFIVVLQPDNVQNAWLVMLGCFFPIVQIFFASAGVSQLEIGTIGFQFNKFNANISGYSMTHCVLGAFIAILVHLLLIVQFEQAIPSEYGASQGFLFPFKAEFWKNEVFQTDSPAQVHSHGGKTSGVSQEGDRVDGQISAAIANDERLASGHAKFANYEELGEKYRVLEKEGRVLKIENLRKEFGNFTAVDDVSVNMYEGEIFALLGHNGAGKTTAISMVTGLIMPTQGEGSFRDVDLFGQMKKIRTTLGVCPQLDVLFDDLTVKEHLEMYQTYKDPSKNFLLDGEQGATMNKRDEVAKWLDKLYLRDQEDVYSQNLSGGTKRRLSVAISLIAGSKLILLDEPSSGMDLTSKYKLWDILKEIKKGRIIILTTHYMDEADYLGDRIAIMGEGKIRCCGSNFYLKQNFGGGYKLLIEFTEKLRAAEKAELFANMEKQMKQEVTDTSDKRIDFKCSKEDDPDFSRLFEYIEAEKDRFKIATQGFGDTNLEDVFLSVSKLNEHHNDNNDIEFEVETAKVAGVEAFFYHFTALTIKRFRYNSRDGFGIACEILLPIVCVIVGLLMRDQASKFSADERPIVFEPSLLFGQKVNDLPTFMPLKAKYFSVDQTGLSSSLVNGATANSILAALATKQPAQLTRENVPSAAGGHSVAYTQNMLDTLKDIDTPMQAQMVDNFDTTEEPLFGLSMYQTENTYSFLVNVNTRQNHIVPMLNNWLSNALLTHFGKDVSIRHSFSPLPRTEKESLTNQAFTLFWYSFFSIIGWSLIPTSAIAFIVKERESLSKYQQYVSGVGVASYWLSNLIWDLTKFILTSAVILLVLFLWDFKEIFQTEYSQLQSLLAGLLIFGTACFMLIYTISFAFNNLLRAMVSMMTYFLGTGIIGQIANSILSVLATFDPKKFGRYDKLVDVTMSLLNPVYAFNRLFTEISLVQNRNLNSFSHNAWDQEKVSKYHVFMTQCIVLMTVVLVSIELSTTNIINTNSKSEDKELVFNAESALSCNHVKKSQNGLFQDTTEAVKGISFNAPNNSCFVILGTNGAGKSSLFKCMTGEIAPTEGNVIVGGKSIVSDQSEARKLIGQCPQDNSIIDLLTAPEHLYFYGRLKQLDAHTLKQSVETMLDMMNLRMNADNLAGRFSGGNKRKLMVACALIGNPKAILLDEPSTGMDPEAKRFMWNSIKKFKKDSGVVMTTHSMDEAEALADNLAIMKQGEFKFVGTLSQLRAQYSKGLYVDLMLKISPEDIQALARELKCRDPELSFKQLKECLEHFTGNQLSWEEVATFGIGKMIQEQIYDKHTGTVSDLARVDAHLLAEFLLVIRQINRITSLLRTNFTGCALEMENIGQLFRFNIVGKTQITCGSLFTLLDSKKEELMINYYSIANSKMETILRSFIEDDSYNSQNSCNVIANLDEKITLKYQDDKQKMKQTDTATTAHDQELEKSAYVILNKNEPNNDLDTIKVKVNDEVNNVENENIKEA